MDKDTLKDMLEYILEQEDLTNVLGVLSEMYEEAGEQTTFPAYHKNNVWLSNVLAATSAAVDINSHTFQNADRRKRMNRLLEELEEIGNPQ